MRTLRVEVRTLQEVHEDCQQLEELKIPNALTITVFFYWGHPGLKETQSAVYVKLPGSLLARCIGCTVAKNNHDRSKINSPDLLL